MESIPYEYKRKPIQNSVRSQSIDNNRLHHIDSTRSHPIDSNELEFNPSREEFSSSLEELDKIELINRNADEFNLIAAPDNNFPSILNSPLFVHTVPPGGIARTEAAKNYKPPLSTDNVSPTDKDFEGRPNNGDILEDHSNDKIKISNMSVSKFIKKIGSAYLDIINDLLCMEDHKELINIFTKDDRLISIGILFIAISVFLVFFNGSN